MAQHTTTNHAGTAAAAPVVDPLMPGDHLDRKTFHARYEQSPDTFRAELIEGIVYVQQPLHLPHADFHARIVFWLGAYQSLTPGTKVLDNVTVALGPYSEPQPDAVLLILPEFGGRVQTQERPIAGPPELVVEVAHSTEAYDLHTKLRDYERAGVTEYVVVVVREPDIVWYRLEGGKYQPVSPGEDTVFRSQVFPGLWLHKQALLDGKMARVFELVKEGAETSEHRVFVEAMAAGRRKA